MLIKNKNPNICGTGGWRVKQIQGKLNATQIFMNELDSHSHQAEIANTLYILTW